MENSTMTMTMSAPLTNRVEKLWKIGLQIAKIVKPLLSERYGPNVKTIALEAWQFTGIYLIKIPLHGYIMVYHYICNFWKNLSSRFVGPCWKNNPGPTALQRLTLAFLYFLHPVRSNTNHLGTLTKVPSKSLVLLLLAAPRGKTKVV